MVSVGLYGRILRRHVQTGHGFLPNTWFRHSLWSLAPSAVENNWTLSGIYWIKTVPELPNKLLNFCESRSFIPCLQRLIISSNPEPVQSSLLSYTVVLWDSISRLWSRLSFSLKPGMYFLLRHACHMSVCHLPWFNWPKLWGTEYTWSPQSPLCNFLCSPVISFSEIQIFPPFPCSLRPSILYFVFHTYMNDR